MRVLHVLGDGNPGGGPVVVETLCAGMANCGVEASIVTQAGSYFFGLATAKGWKTYGVDFTRRKDALRISREIGEILRREDPDIVHAHGARSALPVSLLSQRERPGFVYTIHGFHYDKKAFPTRQFFKLIEKLCISRATEIILVGKGDMAFARKEGLVNDPQRWHQVYNGVELPSGMERSVKPEFDIVYVGRLHPQKNPLMLPAILAATGSKQLRMLIVGGGELEPELRERCRTLGVEHQITMTGAKARAEALELMSKGRVFLLPSLWEGVPVSIVEAMKLGLPIVASRIAGNEELIVHGETGLLACASMPEEFARHILSLLESPALVETLTTKASAFAARLFSVDGQVSEHLRIYQRIASQRAAVSALSNNRAG